MREKLSVRNEENGAGSGSERSLDRRSRELSSALDGGGVMGYGV